MPDQNTTEFNLQVRVYYEDTDAGGVVFHANYLHYLERARTEWLRSVGFGHDHLLEEHEILFAVKNLTINYAKPARLDNLLTVTSRLLTRRGASLLFQQSIKNKDDLLVQAEVKVACLNAKTLKASPIPEALIMGLTQ